MSDVLKTLGLLATVAVLVLVAPVGIAIATTWEPAQTSGLVTGLLTICGGSVAIAALGLGLGLGINLARGRRDEEGGGRAPSYQLQQPSRSELDYWRAEKARIDAARAAVQLQRDQTAIAPPQATAWPAEADAWQWIDATAESNETW